MKLVLTQAALEDLRAVRAYTLAHWGEAQETRYLDRLWARFESIRATPERHPSGRICSPAAGSLRKVAT